MRQDMYPPLLDEYNDRLGDLENLITRAVFGAYEDPESRLFAIGLIKRIKEEL